MYEESKKVRVRVCVCVMFLQQHYLNYVKQDGCFHQLQLPLRAAAAAATIHDDLQKGFG